MWVVGEPTDDVYGSLAVSLLKDSFGLSLEQQEAKRVKVKYQPVTRLTCATSTKGGNAE